MDVEFEIFFSDLNPDAQARLMDAVGISDPSEANWDLDVFPIAVFTTEIEPDPDEDDVVNLCGRSSCDGCLLKFADDPEACKQNKTE